MGVAKSGRRSAGAKVTGGKTGASDAGGATGWIIGGGSQFASARSDGAQSRRPAGSG
jgi:hypothetical protein